MPLRRAEPRRSRTPYFLAVAGAVAVALAWIVSGAGRTIRSVAVSGNRSLSAAEIIRITGVPDKAKMSRAEVRRVKARLMRHPAFLKVSVGRRIGGTLSVRVVERVPSAWLVSCNRAVAQDGVILPHIAVRDTEWILVDGFSIEHGCVRDVRLLQEAGEARLMTGELAEGADGIWRHVAKPPCWEWVLGKKRITFSSPIDEGEVERLRTFKAEFPGAWRKAGGLDLRFKDRVVIKR